MSDKKRFVFAERKKALQIAATCGLSVIEEQCELVGYQIYIVEQWYKTYTCNLYKTKSKEGKTFRMCDRTIDSNVVKVFTGEKSHIVRIREEWFIISTHVDSCSCYCYIYCRASASSTTDSIVFERWRIKHEA